MDTTLGEELLLLSLDEESGSEKEAERTGWAVAAALLVELALADRIAVDGEKVSVRSPAPVGNPGLDPALARIVEHREPRPVKDWMHALKKDAVGEARAGLLEKGLVREETRKVLGLFPVRRYPEADGSAEAAVRRRLDAAVLHTPPADEPAAEGGADGRTADEDTVDERTAALVALLHGAQLHRMVFPDSEPAAVEARMTALARDRWSALAVRQAVTAAQAALNTVANSATLGAVIAVT